jgi:hypothetical protein
LGANRKKRRGDLVLVSTATVLFKPPSDGLDLKRILNAPDFGATQSFRDY